MQVTLLRFRYKIIEKEIMRIFYNFLKYFNSDKIFYLKKKKKFYLKKIIIECSSMTFFVNFEHLIEFSNDFCDNVQENYTYLEFYLRFSLIEFLRNNLNKNTSSQLYWLTLYNLPSKKKLRNVGLKFLNKLTSICGIIIHITGYYPKIFLATFKCASANCRAKIWHTEQRGIYTEPKGCLLCGNNKWNFVPGDSIFIFFQKIKIQKKNPKLFPGDTWTIGVHVKYNFGNLIIPGQKLIFFGSFSVFFNFNGSVEKNKPFYLFIKNPNFNVKNKKINTSYSLYFLAYCSCLYKKFIPKNNFLRERDFFISFKTKIFKIKQNTDLLENFLNLFYNSYVKNQELKLITLLTFINDNTQIIFNQFAKFHFNLSICVIDSFDLDKNKLVADLHKLFPKQIIYINTNSLKSKDLLVKVKQIRNFFEKNKLVYIVDNFNKIDQQNQSRLHLITNSGKIFFCELKKTKYSEKIPPLIMCNSFKKFIYFSSIRYIFHKFDFCFFLAQSESGISNYQISLEFFKKFSPLRNSYYNEQKNFHDFQLYINFIQPLTPILLKKIQKFIINFYKFLRKRNMINQIFLNKFTIKQLESIIKVSRAISKFYLNLYTEEFCIKLAVKILISSVHPCAYSRYRFYQPKIPKSNTQGKVFLKITLEEFNDVKNYMMKKLKKTKSIASSVNYLLKTLLLKIFKKIFFYDKKKISLELIKVGLIVKEFISKKIRPKVRITHAQNRN